MITVTEFGWKQWNAISVLWFKHSGPNCVRINTHVQNIYLQENWEENKNKLQIREYLWMKECKGIQIFLEASFQVWLKPPKQN